MYVNQIFDPVQNKNYVWDAENLQWVAQSLTAAEGPASQVEVTNFPSSQTVDDGGGSITVDGSVSVTGIEESLYALRLDEPSDTVIYVGEAAIGSGESSSVWRIKKVEASGDVTSITWADGNNNFDNSWTNRGSYSYS